MDKTVLSSRFDMLFADACYTKRKLHMMECAMRNGWSEPRKPPLLRRVERGPKLVGYICSITGMRLTVNSGRRVMQMERT